MRERQLPVDAGDVLHESAVNPLTIILARQALSATLSFSVYNTHLDAVERLRKEIVHGAGIAQRTGELALQNEACRTKDGTKSSVSSGGA